MAENQTKDSDVILDAIVANPYKYGFKTEIESEEFEKGLDLKIVQKISRKKKEPQFLIKFREKAFLSWQKMKSPLWASLNIPEIDYDNIDTIRGMDICVVTSAKSDEEGKELLKNFDFPFIN